MKWNTLEHNGPIFPKEYEYIGFDKSLSPLAEEMLYHYSARLETDYVHNATFNKNFWAALKLELQGQYSSLEDCLPLCKKIFTYIQENKQKTPEQKLKEAKQKTELKEKYGTAILNGKEQPIASPMIEPPGILTTRGENPRLGAWKYRTVPEDVSINASNKVAPPEGHTWKECKENKDSFELCKYKVVTSYGVELNKRILFSATSSVKQSSDKKKFEKAIKLIENWEELSQHIQNNLNSNSPTTKQSALVTWLIMNLGIRVGDEKGEDSADTVGASSLRREHISLSGDTLKLNFLGKDSVSYVNSIKMPEEVAQQFSILTSEKKHGEMLFPDISSGHIKDFISSIVSGISAKVFRTAWGSSLFSEGLKTSKIKPTMSNNEKIACFNEANLTVAKKLNHQRNVGKNFESKLEEMKTKLDNMSSNYTLIEKDIKSQVRKLKQKIKDVDDKNFTEKEKAVLRKSYKEKIGRLNLRLKKKLQQVEGFKLKMDLNEKTKNIAMGTSKTAYIDPRIGMSFCNKFDIPLEKLYNKSMQARFEWAMDCKDNYYEKYKTIGEDK